MRILIFISLFSICLGAKAQNLVLNPGFEQYTACPDSLQDSGCVNWKGCISIGTSFPKGSDFFGYYNECSRTPINRPPYCGGVGFRYPKTGKAFVEQRFYDFKGGYRWIPEGFAYIEGKLSPSLLKGEWCFIRFFVSRVAYDGNSINGGSNQGGYIADIGAYLSVSPTDTVSYTQALPFEPQVRHDTTKLIIDTLNWTEISGVFQANGGEKYITLGCFNNNTRLLYGGLYPAFYYIDDVAVLSYQYKVHDTSACTISPFSVRGSYGNVHHMWQDSSMGDSFVISTPGTYWVHYEKDTFSATDTFKVHELPQAQCGYRFRVHDTAVCPLSPIMLQSRFARNIFRQWQDSSRGDSIIISLPGTYWVRYINDTFTASDTFKVQSLSPIECNCNVYAPTAFTPFGDHLNDTFMVTPTCDLNDVVFEVYNRWGEKVYQSASNFSSVSGIQVGSGWDGTFRGATCPQGLYLWRLKGKNISGQVITAKGIVFLINNSKD